MYTMVDGDGEVFGGLRVYFGFYYGATSTCRTCFLHLGNPHFMLTLEEM